MGIWHIFVTTLVEPSDDFCQRIRKSITGVFFIPISILFFLGGLASLAQWGGTFSGIAPPIAQMTTSVVFTVSYGIMRSKRHVSGSHIALVLWLFAVLMLFVYLGFPMYQAKPMIFATASVAMITQIPTIGFIFAFLILQAILSDWNIAQGRAGNHELWLSLPEPQNGDSAIGSFVSSLANTMILMAVIYMFYLQIMESKQRAVAQEAANAMTMRVLQHQRRYATEDVSEILEECTKANVVDRKLIELFREMNDNLESYRPFLPNYLFLQGTDEEDEGAASPVDAEEQQTEGRVYVDDRSSKGGRPNKKYRRNTEVSQTRPGSQHVSDSESRRSGASSGGKGSPVPLALTKGRGPLFSGRVTFALVDIAVDRMLTPGHGRDTSAAVLPMVVQQLYSLANEAKASLHSMLGDTVQLTWNATSSVALPETKGACFLARLAKRLTEPEERKTSKKDTEKEDEESSVLPSLRVSAAICSGKATVHSITSNHHQALIIESPWLPGLEACFALAKQHARGTEGSPHNKENSVVLMDEWTHEGSSMEVEALAVEHISYPMNTIKPVNPTFLCHTPMASIVSDDDGRAEPSQNNEPQAARNATSVVYQLLGEKAREDGEWMYQLQQGDEKDKENKKAVLQLEAIGSMVEGKYGNALALLELLSDDDPSTAPNVTRKREEQEAPGSPYFKDALVARCQQRLLCLHPKK